MSDFYSYLWLREDGTPYYVGKGVGKRAFQQLGHRVHLPADSAQIIICPQLNESEAFESECAIIALFGRIDNGTGCLANLTDGGEGSAGHHYKTPKAVRAALANLQKATASIKGKPKTAEHRQQISEALKKHRRSDEHSQHISAAKIGKPNPNLLGAKNPRWGKPPTNVDALRQLNATRPRDSRGRFYV